MTLVNGAQLLQSAQAGGYAVGAFNCNNMEIVQAIVRAAEQERAPVIIQASQGAIKYAGLRWVATLARLAAEEASVPVALHLDHGTDFQQVIGCIRQGFTSVMYDGSHLSFQENIAATTEIVKVARAVGVSVEGELGRITGTEDEITVADRDAFFTDPDEAQQFVAATGIDALAVAIGTAHGRYRGEPQLDFPRLERIKQRVAAPLVLHGSSGVPDAAIQQAIRLGVCKVNIDTNLREAFAAGIKAVIDRTPEEIDPRRILGPAREAMQAVVQAKMRVFGCSGQAGR